MLNNALIFASNRHLTYDDKKYCDGQKGRSIQDEHAQWQPNEKLAVDN